MAVKVTVKSVPLEPPGWRLGRPERACWLGTRADLGSVPSLPFTCHVTVGRRLPLPAPWVMSLCGTDPGVAESSFRRTVSLKSLEQHQPAGRARTARWPRLLCYHAASCSPQIIGRGNDQVAISSKFETREDTGTLPAGARGGGWGMGGVWVPRGEVQQPGWPVSLW